jgi:hypothetical protein
VSADAWWNNSGKQLRGLQFRKGVTFLLQEAVYMIPHTPFQSCEGTTRTKAVGTQTTTPLCCSRFDFGEAIPHVSNPSISTSPNPTHLKQSLSKLVSNSRGSSEVSYITGCG